MTVAQGYTLVVLAIGAALALRASRQATRGDVVGGTIGGGTALGMVVLALVVDSPL